MTSQRNSFRNRIKPQIERLELRQMLASDVIDPPFGNWPQLKAEFHISVDGEEVGFNDSPNRIAIGKKAGASVVLPAELSFVRPINDQVSVYEATAPIDDALRALIRASEGVEFATNVFVNAVSNSEAVLINEIIVSLDTTLDVADFFARHNEFSSYRPLDGTPDQFIAAVRAGYGEVALAVGNEIAKAPGVNWMSPNFYQTWEKFFTPNDTLYTNQWHLHNTGQGGGTVDADSDLPEAWDVIQGGSSSIVVAVIDDGVQSSHPDLNVWSAPGEIAGDGLDNDGNGWVDDVRGWNFVLNTNNSEPLGTDRHGTSVAGVATARGNNGLGVAGSAYRSRVISIKMFDGNLVASDANITAALNYAAGRTRNGTGTWRAGDLVNNSWGGGANSAAINAALTWGTTSGRQGNGATYLFATGNGFASTVSQPAAQAANIPGVIAVGATNNRAERSNYSNFGPPVDIVAPSSDTRGGYLAIETTDRTGVDGYAAGDYTGTGTTGFGGTSSATPLAAGIAALVLARAEVVGVSLSPVEIRGLMRNATDFLPTHLQDIVTGKNMELGFGRINAFTAVSGVDKAEISVVSTTSEILSGSTVNIGAVNIGQSISLTLRVRNQGTRSLDLSSLTVPAPFSIETGFGDANLAVGESTTFTVKFSPTIPGAVTSIATIGSNDLDEASFLIRFAGTAIPVAVAGTFYEDFVGDGSRSNSDLGINSTGVAFAYLDANSNGIWNTGEQRVFADATGYYAFVTLANGTYSVRSSLTGWSQTGPSGGSYTVTITSPTDFNLGRDFGYAKNGRLYGFAFNDVDSDGIVDAGETGVANQLIFLDQNNNLVFDGPVVGTNNTPVPIVDLATSTSTIAIAAIQTIIDVNVTVNMPHTWMSDMIVTLIGPDGTRVLLASGLGGSEDGYIDTTFDDEAATAIAAGAFPYTGSFRPAALLSAFDGKSTLGNWVLEVRDTFGADEGTIVSWSLNFDSPDRGQFTNAEGFVGLDLSAGTTQVPLIPFGAWDYTLPSDGVNQVTRITTAPVRGTNYGLLFGNFAPTAMAITNGSVPENSAIATLVGRFTTTDQNRRDTFTYSLQSGVGDNDNGAFFIVGDSLYTLAIFDFETQPPLSIRVRTTDSGDLTFERPFTINVGDVNESPTGLTLTPSTIPENEPTGFTIGTLSANDPDAGDTILYQMSNGLGALDNGLFQIQGNLLKSKVTLDFEARSVYSIRVRGTDLAGLNIEGILIIDVSNVNEKPTEITLTGSELFENATVGTLIGNFRVSDVDANDSSVLTLVSGAGSNDNAKFAIVGGELRSNASLDFETQTAYFIRVRATDLGGLSIERQFSVSVLNVNEAPVGVTVTPSSVNEGLAVNSTVGSFATSDPDAFGTFKYELVTNAAFPGNQRFTISGSQLRTAAVFNFDVQSSYSVLVRSTDQGGLSFDQVLVIGILNVNDPPSDIGLSNRSIAEDKPTGSLVGNFTTVDPDGSDTFTYRLVAGNGALDNASFAIAGNQLRTNTSLNFELKSSYSIRVQSRDSGGVAIEKVFVVDVTNVNEVPTGLTLTPATIPENSVLGTVVGAFASQDADLGDSFTYSFASGTGSADNNKFTIVAGSLRANALFDFELVSNYSVRIRTTDAGGLSTESPFIVSVTNVNEAPFNLSLSGVLPENTPLNVVALNVNASDNDAGDALTFSFVNGPGAIDNAKFALNSSGGLRHLMPVDFEQQSSYSIRLRATDLGGLFAESTFTIGALDQNEAPTAINLNPNSLSENAAAETSVGFLSTIDEDTSDSFAYSFVSGTGSDDNTSFSLVGGEIRSLTSFDFETKSAYRIRVKTTDLGGLSIENSFSISIKDVNETPLSISVSNSSIVENSTNALVGLLSTSDVDAGETFVYSLVSGVGSTDNGSFAILNNQIQATTPFDFEAKNSYSILVRSTDRGGLFTETPFVISVTDVNELPTNLQVSSSSLFENLAVGTLIGTLSAVDPDVGDSVSFLFVTGSNDNEKFSLSGNQLRSAEAFNFEAKASYLVDIQVVDKSFNGQIRTFTISINDANDPIIDLGLSATIVNENVAAGSLVSLLTAVDPDASEIHQFSLVDGTGATDNSKFSIVGNELSLLSSPNFESQSSYAIRVRGIDRGGLSFVKSFVINVSDLPEAPTNLSLGNFRINENASALSVVGAFSATDPDVNDTLTYSFVTGEGATNNNLFNLTSGNLVAKSGFDFEATPNLFVRVRATDSTQRFPEDFFVIVVDNVNETPTNIVVPNKSLAENRPAGTLVSILSTIDSDVDETYTYSLVPTLTTGDNIRFAIVGNELRTNRKLNFEAQSSHALRIRSTDSTGLFVEVPVTIIVTDVNELAIIAATDAASTPTDLKVVIDVLANDRDPDGVIDPTTVRIVSAPTAGSILVLSDGRIEFTPPAGRRQSLTFSYSVMDNDEVVSNTALVSVKVFSAFQNQRNPLDVDDDGSITPLDVLALVNDINANKIRELPTGVPSNAPYLDTNGNGQVDPLDVLEIVNFINASRAGGGGAEGESRIDASKVDYAFASTDLESLVDSSRSKLTKLDRMLFVDDYYQNLDQKRSRRR